MDSRCAAAAPPVLQYPHALLALPDLDRPPALLATWEMEAIARALPAKKQRLRETFDRLAACSPAPLPFRWDDLDAYISSLQYSATLRSRHLRGLDKSRPTTPGPASISAPALVPASISALAAATGGDVVDKSKKRKASNQEATTEKAEEPMRMQVAEAEKGKVDEIATAAAPASMSAPAAATGADVVEKSRKRKAPNHEMATADEPMCKQVAEAETGKVDEIATAAAKKASPSQDMDGNGKKLSPPPTGGGNVLAEPHASTDATVQVDPVGKVAVVQQELPAAKRHALDSVNHVKKAGDPNSAGEQRRRPPRLVPAPAAVSAPAITGGDVNNGKKLKVSSQGAEAAHGKMQMQVSAEEMREVDGDSAAAKNPSHVGVQAKVSPCPPAGGVGNVSACTTSIVRASADVSMQAAPVCKIAGVRQGFAAATPNTSNAGDHVPASAPMASSHLVAKAPKLEPVEEAADVEMEVVEAEEQTPEIIKEVVQAQEANKVSVAPPETGNGLRVDAACKSSNVRHEMPTMCHGSRSTRHARNLMPGSTLRSCNHVLQKQHMAKEHPDEPTYRAQKHDNFFSRNHGGRPTGSRHVPEAQAAAPRLYKKPGPGSGNPRRGEFAADYERDLQGNDSISSGNGKGKPHVYQPSERSKQHPPPFCKRCGSVGHLAHQCRTAKHLVELYQKDKKEREANQICYRCGCWGHWSRICKTPQHLVDLYKKDRQARLESLHTN
ncbi:hypothetical protein ACP70R_045728 [Stipagrostis hirtigluma subsp. patula]